jgi:hypothetical protein
MDAQGNHIGYMAEQEKGLGNAMARQWFRTHRSFVTHVFDRQENEVLRVSLQSDLMVQIGNLILTFAVQPPLLLHQLQDSSI